MTERHLTLTEWRLYLTAALALVFVLAWRAIAATVRPTAVASVPAPVPVRPVIVVPPGWQVAGPSAPPAPAARPALVRAAPARRHRVRTRSS